MTSLPALVAALSPSDAGLTVTIPENWLQGRTAYGGLSAALALAATQRSVDALPPLRSAQIAFIGPLAGEVTITIEVLRRGRTAAFVQADIHVAGALGLRAMFVFMHALPSHVALAPVPLASLPPRGNPFVPHPEAVRFASNFELLHARVGDEGPADIVRWARLRDRAELDPSVELVAIGDVLPPAAMPLFKKPGPISSLTWQINLLADPPISPDGWWLARSTAAHAQAGNSAQTMMIWDSAGRPTAAGTQSVALFV